MRFISSTFFKNFASLSIVNVANNVLPLLTVPYVTRIIGPERYGLMNFSHALVGYFVLIINYGFDLSASKRVASAKEDKQELNNIFSETLLIKAVLFLTTTIIFITVISLIPALRAERELHCVTYLSTIGHVIYPTWFFQGMERLSRTAIINLVIKLLFTCLVFILVKQPNDYLYQNLSISVAHTIGGSIALIMAIKQFGIRLLPVSWPKAILSLKQGFVTFYYTVTSTLYTSTNIVILQITSDSSSVGYFTAGYRVEAIIRTFILVAFGQSIYPIAARLFEKNRQAALELIQSIIPVVSGLTLLIGVSLFFLSDTITTTLFGYSFKETIIVIRIISLMPLFVSLNYILGVLTMMNLNYKKQFVIITTCGSIVGLLMNFILSNKYHQLGTSAAWVGTEGCILISLVVFLHYNEVPILGNYQRVKSNWNILFSKVAK